MICSRRVFENYIVKRLCAPLSSPCMLTEMKESKKIIRMSATRQYGQTRNMFMGSISE